MPSRLRFSFLSSFVPFRYPTRLLTNLYGCSTFRSQYPLAVKPLLLPYPLLFSFIRILAHNSPFVRQTLFVLV